MAQSEKAEGKWESSLDDSLINLTGTTFEFVLYHFAYLAIYASIVCNISVICSLKHDHTVIDSVIKLSDDYYCS